MVGDVMNSRQHDAQCFAPNPVLREADLAPPTDEAMYGSVGDGRRS